MKRGYLDELIDRYKAGEINDADVCDNITRITKKEDYIKDVNENRTRDKLADRYNFIRFGKSPEDILIGWEEDEHIMHFISWIRSVLNEGEWDVFSQHSLYNTSTAELAEREGLARKSINRKLRTISHKINKYIPYYNEQFGDLREYLYD